MDLAIVQAKINQDMMNFNDWLVHNRMVTNVKKTRAMPTGLRQVVNHANKLKVHLNNEIIDQVTSFEFVLTMFFLGNRTFPGYVRELI